MVGWKKILFGGMLAGLWVLMMGCAASTTLTKEDVRLYWGESPRPPRVEPDSLIIASYNIAFSEKLDEALADLQSDPHLQNLDILLLQEMDAKGTAYMAESLGMNYYYFPSFIHPRHGELFGNAVLSPWPLGNPETLTLPHPNPLTTDYRTALLVEVQMGSRKVRAVSVHLATLVVDLDDRVEQAEAMRDSLLAEPGPMLVGGDFNSGTNYEVTLFGRVMRQVGFRQARIPGDKTARGGLLDKTGYDLKLDHIYYRDLVFVSGGSQPEGTASDHFPIWSVFRWRE